MSKPDRADKAGSERGYHIPVLLDEVIEMLITDPDGIYVDGTLGGGGHSRALAERLGPKGKLFAFDRDLEALEENRAWADAFGDQVTIAQGNFGEMARLLEQRGVAAVNGILLDLGVSSHQLDEGERGFSFMRPGPLDMRMGPDAAQPAHELINTLGEEELVRLFRTYGEEPRARRAAKAVVEARAEAPILTTEALAGLIERALGRRSGKHPATRIFQALRIAVNREMETLAAFLESFEPLLVPGARVAIIAYHSLEDRLVKQTFRKLEPQCICPPQALQCTCGHPGSLKAVNRRAVKSPPGEVAANPRARSARLRVAQKLAQTV